MVPPGEAVGFPSPLLGPEPRRLAVLWRSPSLLVLEKPAGVWVAPVDGPNAGPSIVQGLRVQAGKPELGRLGIGGVHPVFTYEPEVSGMAVFAQGKEWVDPWCNCFGSGGMELRFLLLIRDPPSFSRVTCDLPLQRQPEQDRVRVSHRLGKQARTEFRALSHWGTLALWEARARFLRWHQIRLHARECGLNLTGESLYGVTPPVRLRECPRRGIQNWDPDAAPHPGLALHLAALEFLRSPDDSVAGSVEAPLPRTFRLLCRRAGGSLPEAET